MKKGKKITIVTAFFDIGRNKYVKIPRSNDKYLRHFEFWARIKNDLIVYTTADLKTKILSIREKFNLKEKTKVIVIDDITKIEPAILTRMQEIEHDNKFIAFRYLDDMPENRALYNYVMMLKSWFIYDASKMIKSDELLAWIDFGYNHGGDKFSDCNDFCFEWKYDFPDKVTYFYNKEINNKPVFYLVQSFELNIMGAPFVVSKTYAKEHWDLIRNAMITLIDVGLIDDDQTLMLMAYRKKPEIFNLMKSDWFMPLKDYGGEHLKIKCLQNKISFKDKMLKKYRIKKRNKTYLKKFKKEFLKDYLD